MPSRRDNEELGSGEDGLGDRLGNSFYTDVVQI